ncbi:MAG: hypothetical protein H0X29_05050 [Parachlamydiaceae bacterium]|nr:hypothetical protein [Parachlamydiaceae bacterium]
MSSVGFNTTIKNVVPLIGREIAKTSNGRVSIKSNSYPKRFFSSQYVEQPKLELRNFSAMSEAAASCKTAQVGVKIVMGSKNGESGNVTDPVFKTIIAVISSSSQTKRASLLAVALNKTPDVFYDLINCDKLVACANEFCDSVTIEKIKELIDKEYSRQALVQILISWEEAKLQKDKQIIITNLGDTLHWLFNQAKKLAADPALL